MKTSPPSLSLSHSLQSSVRVSIVMQDVPVSCGANSTIVSPLGSGDSHDLSLIHISEPTRPY